MIKKANVEVDEGDPRLRSGLPKRLTYSVLWHLVKAYVFCGASSS